MAKGIDRKASLMGQLFDEIVKFFEAEDWPVELQADALKLRTGYIGEQGRWRCYAVVDEEKAQVAFYSIYPEHALPERYAAVAEFLHRANFGLVLGNFEFDYDDGEIRFRTGMDVENVKVTLDLLVPLVYANVAQMNRYFGGLKQVLTTESTPEEIIRTIEANLGPDVSESE